MIKEFIKPVSKYISDKEYIQNLVNVNLQKDLYNDEEVCEYCHGSGLTIVDNRYGLTEDPDKSINNMFPYKHQSITFCPHCFNGIVHRCPLCGEIMKKGQLICNCEQQRELDRNKRLQKRQEIIDKTPIAPKEVEDKLECLYLEDCSYNEGYFIDFEDFFEYWSQYHEPTDEKPEFMWITEPHDFHIDAYSLISDATEDLYEDAFDDVNDKMINELQDYLNKWCEKCGVRRTYYPSYKYKVRIPWEETNGI